MFKILCRKKPALLILILAAFFFGAMACSEKDDVTAIRALIKKGAALAEDHNIGDIMDLTTEDVVALPGRHNRLNIKRIIWSVFQRYGEFKILYPKPSVELSPENNSASSSIYLLIVKKEQTYPGLKDLTDDPKQWLETVGENADLYQVNLEMVKKDGDWLVKQAHLELFRGLGFSE